MQEIDKIFEVVVQNFEKKEKKDLWKNAKYSPCVLPSLNKNADNVDILNVQTK